MNSSKSMHDIGGFTSYSRSDSEDLASDESGWWRSNYFQFVLSIYQFVHSSLFIILTNTVQAMSTVIFFVSLQMLWLSIFK